jgi:hypothetical protein
MKFKIGLNEDFGAKRAKIEAESLSGRKKNPYLHFEV